MHIDSFLERAAAIDLKPVVLGDRGRGVAIFPEAEGRIFTIMDGRVTSRVVTSLLDDTPQPEPSLALGGDVLWIAPEGTPAGFFYPQGEWGIPQALVGLRYDIEEQDENRLRMASAPLDFRNNCGQEITLRLGRDVRRLVADKGVAYETTETVSVLEAPASDAPFVVVPWTLSQYGATVASRVTFPAGRWIDVYSPVGDALTAHGDTLTLATDGQRRFQLITAPDMSEITLRQEGLVITRTFLACSEGAPADIRDLDPKRPPEPRFPARMSVFNSDEGFLELEACGTCPQSLQPGTTLSMCIRTSCRREG